MDKREEFLRRETKRRNVFSGSLTAAAYALAAIVLLLLSSMLDKSLEGEPGPLRIKLGAPSGSESAPFNAAPEAAVAAVVEPAPLEAVPPEEPPPLEEDGRKPRLVEAASPRPSPKPSQAPRSPAPPAKAASPAPSGAAIASASSSPRAGSALSPAPSSVPGPEVVVMKGSEAGNSWETRFEGGSGLIGRSFYEDIYLYMPMPYEVPSQYFDAIPARGFQDADAQKKLFLTRYVKEGGSYVLKTPVPLSERYDLWLMLEDARFPVKRADYKKDKYLRPVVIRFRVGSTKGGTAPTLMDVELKRSSGYSDIDEAVLYGFRRATFYNDSDKAVWGTFTYVFD